MTLRVLIKGEVDVVRAFGVEESSSPGPALFSGSASAPIELIVEPPVRTEVLAQQLAASSPSKSSITTRAADPDIDVVVLSIAGDLTRDLFRKPGSDELVDSGSIDVASTGYEPAESDFENGAAAVVEHLAAANAPLVVWFTASTVNGEDEPHRWARGETPFSVRANRLNLSLARLSQKTGVCFVDADRLLAELGADQHVEGPLRYSAEASARLGEEFIRILTDTGKLEPSLVGHEKPSEA
jgi:hypothetical protein